MKIVFCGGGSAGHITPNLALIDELSMEENYYIGTNGMEKSLLEKYVQQGKVKEFCEISATKLKRKFTLTSFLLPFKLIKSVKEAKSHLKKINPDVVFSKGGYVGLPVVIAAHKLKIPTIVHESDMTVGLANKISAMFASQLLSTYPCHKKAKVVGAIIRKDILNGNRQIGLDTMEFDGTKPILLVVGGSLGAKALNDAICQNPNLANKFDIFVICGKNKSVNCDFVHSAEFVTNIADIFAATTVCVTRAGSNALCELTLANVPFLAVPLTKCSRGEQVKNAQWFADNGCGMCLSETNLAEKLENAVNKLLSNRQNIQNMQKKHTNLLGTEKVVDEILKYKKQNEMS